MFDWLFSLFGSDKKTEEEKKKETDVKQEIVVKPVPKPRPSSNDDFSTSNHSGSYCM